MRRIAFFVEGFSEMLFVEQLVTAIAGAHKVVVEQHQIKGGVRVPRSVVVVKAAAADQGQEFYVLIVDCCGDHQVKTRLLEEHENLTKAGYEKIICIRDVRPTFTREQIPQLEMGLRKYVKGSLAPVDFVLSTMEVEAWFIAEFNHFSKIDASITVEKVYKLLGFHPENDDPSLRDEPADDLRKCYALGGKTYEKSEAIRTVQSLDYAYVYTGLKDRISAIKRISDHVDAFLTPAT